MFEDGFETISIHGGFTGDPSEASRAVPVHRTSAYLFKDTEHAANLFALQAPGNIYTRLGNPTQAVLEERTAALEGGAAAVALASGTNAVFYAIINICAQGDEVAASKNLYGGTYTMFNDILPSYGIKTRFFDLNDEESLNAAVTERTKLVFVETIGNPTLDVADLNILADRAHDAGIPLIVDNTFATPYLCRPIEHGADIVVHSLTKWIGGHGTGIGGIVVDSGKFDWSSGKFPLMTEPDSSYHGLRYAYDLGEMNAVGYAVRLRLVPLRNLGGCISPDNSWMFLQGFETLALRMQRHSENALKAAEILMKHDRVAWVRYPGLETDPSNELARKYLRNPQNGGGAGGMVVFGINGGRDAGSRFINSLKLFSHLANVGDAKSLAIHPASTTHSQLDAKALEDAGIGEDMIRLSIGIESIDDIIGDLKQALAES
ncbi:MAG: O-acetylhomoserine aminocarboxypropyltransferase/cysteine synthase [Spirochaetales bacterium]|uniref:O-acetylhomoserine aminocarboxypropyltransferase/cysteine synthase n=1 Tax=Candidatus Thalassospirochaeta sargassi TaxID=3119039 RepID=A0AAJ1IIY3_9SPIO|nr:O-acetylhomoserine aminocarboxypropyltransferase/cysteine synthase [Spirochaetales bacterium]